MLRGFFSLNTVMNKSTKGLTERSCLPPAVPTVSERLGQKAQRIPPPQSQVLRAASAPDLRP